jgi:hypothetical protein
LLLALAQAAVVVTQQRPATPVAVAVVEALARPVAYLFQRFFCQMFFTYRSVLAVRVEQPQLLAVAECVRWCPSILTLARSTACALAVAPRLLVAALDQVEAVAALAMHSLQPSQQSNPCQPLALAFWIPCPV